MRQDAENALLELERTDDGFRTRHVFPPELPVFAGHFPNEAIVPGVFMLEALRQSVSCVVGRSVQMSCLVKAAFTEKVQPGEVITTEAKILALEDGEWDVRATFGTSRGTSAEVRVRFTLRECRT